MDRGDYAGLFLNDPVTDAVFQGHESQTIHTPLGFDKPVELH
jgi:hypothetical protein